MNHFGGVLPNRKHVVLTHNLDFEVNNENVRIVNSIYDLDEYINSKEECFVIGGGLVYTLLMPYTQKLYVTEIDKEFEGDTLFPIIKPDDWKEVERIPGPETESISYKYEYVTYIRK